VANATFTLCHHARNNLKHYFTGVQPYHKGIASTGKSTGLRTVEYIYDSSDVGAISNTVERTFPLEALLDVFIYLGMGT